MFYVKPYYEDIPGTIYASELFLVNQFVYKAVGDHI